MRIWSWLSFSTMPRPTSALTENPQLIDLPYFCTPVRFKNLPVELGSRGCDLSGEDPIIVVFPYTVLAHIRID